MFYVPDQRLLGARQMLTPVASQWGTGPNLQPQYPTIDWRHRFAQGLILCVNNPVRDLARGHRIDSHRIRTETGTMRFVDSASKIQYPSPDDIDGGFTATIVLPKWPPTSQKTTLFTFGRTRSNVEGEIMAYIHHGNITLFSYRSGYQHRVNEPCVDLDDDRGAASITCSIDFDGEARVYINGAGSEVDSGTINNPTLSPASIGCDLRDGDHADAVSLFLLHNYPLAEREAVSLSKNPYQIFAPW